MKDINTVPNQRVVTVNKAACDRNNVYTTNNLSALGQAARRLQSKGGFKLYIYLAKNQDKHTFALSSADFIVWSGIGINAYYTAFDELKEQGYLIPKEEDSNIFYFYDKSQIRDKNSIDDIEIEYPEQKPEDNKSGFRF